VVVGSSIFAKSLEFEVLIERAFAAAFEVYAVISAFAGFPMLQPAISLEAHYGDGLGISQYGTEVLHPGGEFRGQCGHTAVSPCRADMMQDCGGIGARVHGTAPSRSRQSARGGCGTALAPPVAPSVQHEPSAVRNEFKSLFSELSAAVYDTGKSKDEKSIEVGRIHRRVVAIGLGYRSLVREDQILLQAVEQATACGFRLLQ